MADNTTLIRAAFERPQWYLDSTAYNIKLRAETILEFLGTDNIGSILDVGCGDGSLSRGLLNSNNRLTLLDASQAMLKIARSRVPEDLAWRVQTINSDFMGAALEPGSFDLIICVGVLAYVEDRKAFIARIKSLLKPGGSVITECTDGSHWLSRLIGVYHALLRCLRPPEMRTVVAPSSQVVSIFDDLGFKRCGSYRYALALPIIRKLMSQGFRLKMIRWLHGSASSNRGAWLGNECMYYFKSPTQ